MPPLIKTRLVLNNSLEIFGIYDSGSNVSLINSKLLKIRNKNSDLSVNTNLKTINGVKKAAGRITLDVKIFDIKKKISVFVIYEKDFNYNFLIGLDCIKNFHLIQDENLEIKQKIPKIGEIKIENIKQKLMEEGNNQNANKSEKVKATSQEKSEFKNKNNSVNLGNKNVINFNEHVSEENFEIQINHLDYNQQAEIDNLTAEYNSIFAKDKYDVSTVTGYEAHIDLIIDKYCSKRPYRCTLEDRKEIGDQIRKLLKTKLIEESYSPFAAPVTLAFKRDENRKPRLCIDFRELNKIVVPQSQPFPLIEDLVEKTRDCRFFSTLDINSAFWSIPLRITDRPKTGFVT